jgi:phage FluMu protein Com
MQKSHIITPHRYPGVLILLTGRGVRKLIDFRCKRCNRLLGKYKDCKQLEIKCPRCGYNNQVYLANESIAQIGVEKGSIGKKEFNK